MILTRWCTRCCCGYKGRRWNTDKGRGRTGERARAGRGGSGRHRQQSAVRRRGRRPRAPGRKNEKEDRSHLICSLMAASRSGMKLQRARDSDAALVLATVASSALTCCGVVAFLRGLSCLVSGGGTNGRKRYDGRLRAPRACDLQSFRFVSAARSHLVEGLEDDASQLRRRLAGGAGGGGQAAGAEGGRADAAVSRKRGGRGERGEGIVSDGAQEGRGETLQLCERGGRHGTDPCMGLLSGADARRAAAGRRGRAVIHRHSLALLLCSNIASAPSCRSLRRWRRPADRACDVHGDHKLTRRRATTRRPRRGSGGGPSRMCVCVKRARGERQGRREGGRD